MPQFLAAGVQLRNFLHSRNLPVEKFVKESKIREIRSKLVETKCERDTCI